jgi:hypothetical protein
LETVIKNCCEPCSDIIESTVECFTDCLPECVTNTTLTYYACASFDLYGCEATCTTALAEYPSKTTTTTTTGDDNNNNTVAFELLMGMDLSALTIELNCFNNTLESLNSQGYCELSNCCPCTTVQDNMSIEGGVCELANCCPYCIDQFEAMVECVMTDVVLHQIMGRTENECDIECGENQAFMERPNGGSGGFNNNNNQKRHLQPSSDVVTNGPPDFTQALSQGRIAERLQDLFTQCRTDMATQLAIDRPALAFDSYLSCVTQYSLINLPTLAPGAPGSTTTAPTMAPATTAAAGATSSATTTTTTTTTSFMGVSSTWTVVFTMVAYLVW